MKKITILCIGPIAFRNSFGQTKPLYDEMVKPTSVPGINEPVEEKQSPVTLPVKPDYEIFIRAEIMPSFPGGEAAFKKYLEKNLNVDVPVLNNAPAGTYTVTLRFIVSKTGEISEITPETRFGYDIEQEAIRVLKLSPKWNPAIQNGHNVNAYTRQVITFIVPKK